jgi:hypothetical protein
MAAPKAKKSDSEAERELQGFIDKFTPEIAALARACLKKLRARLPGATQTIYDNYNALAIGFGPSNRASEAVFSLVLYPRWVTLFFLRGAGLPDPHGILKGSGNVVRHTVLASAADLDKPAVRELMATALNRAIVPIDPAAAAGMEIRAIAAKQRPRRPANA